MQFPCHTRQESAAPPPISATYFTLYTDLAGDQRAQHAAGHLSITRDGFKICIEKKKKPQCELRSRGRDRCSFPADMMEHLRRRQWRQITAAGTGEESELTRLTPYMPQSLVTAVRQREGASPVIQSLVGCHSRPLRPLHTSIRRRSHVRCHF